MNSTFVFHENNLFFVKSTIFRENNYCQSNNCTPESAPLNLGPEMQGMPNSPLIEPPSSAASVMSMNTFFNK